MELLAFFLAKRSSPCLTLLLLLGLAAASSAGAQAAGGSTQPASTATPIPLSGRQQSGTVTAQDAPQAGGGSSVDVLMPSVQVQGPYAGSSQAPTGSGAVDLSLSDAVQRGLRFNLGEVGASNTLRQARAQRAEEMAALLPSVSASFSETGAKIDLQAEGLSSSTLSSFGSLGLAFPTTVGPFHYYQAAANVSGNIFDLTALHNLRAAVAGAQGAALSEQDARQAVILAVCGSYMQVLANQALATYDEDQVRYAQASYDQASARLQAGTTAQIDATRSLVELHEEQERLASQQATVTKQKLELARLIGISLNADLRLTSRMDAGTAVPMTLEQAIRQADATRADLQAAAAQLKMAEENLKAAHAERLPTASMQGDYGLQGINPNHGAQVFSATASVNIPIFSGGRIRADAAQADAALAQRRAELEDQRGAVELQVREAYLDLQVAAGQVSLAKENQTLALDTLRQSQDRFAAGATTSVEVVQSQQTLGAANRDYVNALFAENLARISLARTMGRADQSVPTLLSSQSKDSR